MTKVCCKCGERKPVTEFHRAPGNKDGLDGQCKSCRRVTNKAWRDKNKEKVRRNQREYRAAHRDLLRDQQYRIRYGVSLDEYNRIFDRQSGVCAICRQPETDVNKWGNPKRLSVDHDHETGEVRGLLCHHCNTGIGLFGDSVDRLLDAAAYLEGE